MKGALKFAKIAEMLAKRPLKLLRRHEGSLQILSPDWSILNSLFREEMQTFNRVKIRRSL